MDALDRILPLAAFLWPTLDCDASIRRDPSSACASTGAAYLARVFDCDHPDGMDARPLAEAAGDTPAASAEALAAHLAALARPRFDALRRVMGDAATRADLAADVARLERGVADLTRERDPAPACPAALFGAQQQLRRAAEAVATARHAGRRAE